MRHLSQSVQLVFGYMRLVRSSLNFVWSYLFYTFSFPFFDQRFISPRFFVLIFSTLTLEFLVVLPGDSSLGHDAIAVSELSMATESFIASATATGKLPTLLAFLTYGPVLSALFAHILS